MQRSGQLRIGHESGDPQPVTGRFGLPRELLGQVGMAVRGPAQADQVDAGRQRSDHLLVAAVGEEEAEDDRITASLRDLGGREAGAAPATESSVGCGPGDRSR